ncbi:MAG: carbohydrate ABC transporter permease [Acidimicrobiales bacterium]
MTTGTVAGSSLRGGLGTAMAKPNGFGRVARAVRRARKDPARVVIFVALVIASFVMLYPFGFMLLTSLHSQAQYINGKGYSFSSWSGLFSALPVGRELLNSTLVAVSAIAIILVVSSSAGFAFAKLKFRGQGIVFVAIIGSMMVPLQSIIIPEYVNFAHVHLINSYLGAILVYAAMGSPFATFLMTTFYRGLPEELVEAAVCDGLGYEGTFWRVALPLATPALATVAVLQFIQIWDDLLIGLLFLQEPTNRTITVGLGVLASGRVVAIPELMAGSLISALPAVLVYLFFQRYLVAGLTLGVNR